MACSNQASAFFLIALILFATANPPAHAIISPRGDVKVDGRVCCTRTANCLVGSQGAPGVVVKLNCSTRAGVSAEVGRTTTDETGRFSIAIVRDILLTIVGVVLDGSGLPCIAIVQSSADQNPVCPALSTFNDTRVGVLGPVRPVVTPSIFGYEAQMLVFFHLPCHGNKCWETDVSPLLII